MASARSLLSILLAVPLLFAEPVRAEGPRVRGLVQVWYTFDQADYDAFLVRRTFLWTSGQVTPNLSYSVLLNPAKLLLPPAIVPDPARPGSFVARHAGDDKLLEDAFLKATWGTWSLQAGQFRMPVSFNALEQASELATLRRALFNEGPAQIGFYRDIGLQLNFKPLDALDCSLALLNGEGPNQPERNHLKDAAARLNVRLAPDVQVGAGHLEGRRGADGHLRRMTGLNAEWRLTPVVLRAEGLYGQEGQVHQLGWYGQASAFLLPSLQGVVRYEGWTPNMDQATEERDLTLGANWMLVDSSRASLNLIHQGLPAGKSNNLAILAWQLTL